MQLYPMCLYKGEQTCTVNDDAEHRAAAKDGWITAGEFHGYEGAAPAFSDDENTDEGGDKDEGRDTDENNKAGGEPDTKKRTRKKTQ